MVLLVLIAVVRGQATRTPNKTPATAPAAAGASTGPTPDRPVVTIPPFAPIGALKEYVCAFHLYAHDNRRQMQAHHYCSVINCGKLRQCVLYDNSTAGARLLGIEYLIPADVFAGLPAEEQQLWHSHKYEVRLADGELCWLESKDLGHCSSNGTLLASNSCAMVLSPKHFPHI